MSSTFWFCCSGNGDGTLVIKGLVGGGKRCTSGMELPFHIEESSSGVDKRRLFQHKNFFFEVLQKQIKISVTTEEL